MKVAIISTCYLKQINSLYQKYSHLENLNNEAELEALLNYSASQFYYWKQYLNESGVEIEIFCQDLTWINQKWAREQKISPLKNISDDELFLHRIKLFGPDILFVFSPNYYSDQLKRIKSEVPSIKKIVAWYGASQGDENKTFLSYDLTLTNSKFCRQRLHSMGMKAEILQHSFEYNSYDEILQARKSSNQKRNNKLIFTGTLGFQNPDHLSRTTHLEQLAQSVDIDLFSDDIPYQKTKKQILLETRFKISSLLSDQLGKLTPKRIKLWGNIYNQAVFPKHSTKTLAQSLKSAVYGKDMLEELLQYQICFNFHSNATGDSACNMRLFEATGMGCCLLTDYKSDIDSLFVPDTEVVTYKSVDEAISKARYLLNNPKIARKIALAGQKKTFTEHTTEKQVDHLVYYLKNLWN